MFSAPIPGQSLTGSPQQYPWERPPEMVDPEEVIQFYLSKLLKKEVTEGLMDSLELGIDIKTMTEGILRNGVAKGYHSIDNSLIVAPVIHEYIKTTADKLGVPYDEGFVDEAQKREEERSIRLAKVEHRLAKEKSTPQKAPRTEVNVPQDTQEPPRRGFVQRPVGATTGDLTSEV